MDLIRPAVEGTERALNAGLKAGVERIVLTSSMAAIAYGHDRARTAPFTAADWTDLDGRGVNAYAESKTRAERRAWEMMKAAGREADLVSINPSAIYGPLLDEDPGTSVALIQPAAQGRLARACRASSSPIIDVRDVAAAHVAALTGPSGRRTAHPDGRRTRCRDGDRQHHAPALPRARPQDAAHRHAGLGGAALCAVRPAMCATMSANSA